MGAAYRISAERSEMDVEAIHAYLSRSYWAAGVPVDVVRRSVENSLCFGVFQGTMQVGFGRVVTDLATFGYLADVYILEAHQKRGLGKRLISSIMDHPDLRGLRRMLLATRDAHQLYAKFGFTALGSPEVLMERHRPDIYA